MLRGQVRAARHGHFGPNVEARECSRGESEIVAPEHEKSRAAPVRFNETYLIAWSKRIGDDPYDTRRVGSRVTT